MESNSKPSCLIVDDNEAIREICAMVASSIGFDCLEAPDAERALTIIEGQHPSLLMTDLVLPGMTGIDLVRQAREILPDLEMVIMTGHPSLESAIDALRLRACDYISKPFSIAALKSLLQRIHDKVPAAPEPTEIRKITPTVAVGGFVGSSRKVREMVRLIHRIKDLRMPVLVTGESGTGKELVTRAIHELSARPERPFVVMDCGALVPTLIESELFGYEKGAFTGAVGSKKGLFQAANGGTIFLDEIGELPLELQTKLLRVLQQKEVRPVGSNNPVKIDVRVIAATNRNLELECAKGRFRRDLYFRLNVIRIPLAPLRSRREDIPELAYHFVHKIAPDRDIQVSTQAMGAMLNYDWPGNVREMENCIERALALGNRRSIELDDLPTVIQECIPKMSCSEGPHTDGGAMPELLRAPDRRATEGAELVERDAILQTLEEAQGDKHLAGKLLGMSRATLYRKLKRYSIGSDEIRVAGSASEA
jgi:two-component system, NtrC family, response regulator AtoC